MDIEKEPMALNALDEIRVLFRNFIRQLDLNVSWIFDVFNGMGLMSVNSVEFEIV